MPFPKSLLADHEELILDLRPHWVALVIPCLIGAACVAGMGLAVAWTGPTGIGPPLQWAGLAVAFIVLLLFCVRQVVNWFTDNFVVTTDRVVRRRGLIAKNSMEIPLEAITDVRFQQGIIGRMIGSGSLIISSASERGREEFADIRHPERVQKTIYEMGEQNQRRMFAGGSKHTGTGGTESVAEEIRKLSRLRDDGVLTEVEFQSQKDKLLGTDDASSAAAPSAAPPPVVSPPPADDTPPPAVPPPVPPPPTT